MQMRITIKPTPHRTDDLRIAANIRRELFVHSPVEVDPDNPIHSTHRDEKGRAYFEFSTEFPDEVKRVLAERGYAGLVDLTESLEAKGEPCQNCGNIAGAVCPTVCPNCGFRDISPCPVCAEEISRQRYLRLGDTLFRCPNCKSRVHLRFNEPIVLADGHYNQPLVVVDAVEVGMV